MENNRIAWIIGLIVCFGLGALVGGLYYSGESKTPGWERTFAFSSTMGTWAKDPTGEQLGKIDDFVFDDHGRVAFAIISYGEKTVAVPFGALTYDGQAKDFVVNTTKERLESAPSFDKTRDLADRKWAEDIYRHFGQRPYWTEPELVSEERIPEEQTEGTPYSDWPGP